MMIDLLVVKLLPLLPSHDTCCNVYCVCLSLSLSLFRLHLQGHILIAALLQGGGVAQP